MEELQAINELLAKGMTVIEAEKHLGYSEGTLRKKLSKAGYKCDRKLNQYIPKDGIVTSSNPILQEGKIQEVKGGLVTRSNGATLKQEKKKDRRSTQSFTVEQMDILNQMINEYIVRQHIQSDVNIDKGKTINRNVRVYEKQFESFAKWCKVNNVTQADALYKAINLLMQTQSH